MFWIYFPTLRLSHLSAGVIHWRSVKALWNLRLHLPIPQRASRGRGGNVGEGMALSGKTNQPPQKHGWNFMRHLKSTTYLTCVCRGLINPVRVKSTHGRGAHAFSVKSTQWKVNPVWAKHHVHATKHGSSSTKHHAGFARIIAKHRDIQGPSTWNEENTAHSTSNMKTWEINIARNSTLSCTSHRAHHFESTLLRTSWLNLPAQYIWVSCLVTPPPTHFKQKQSKRFKQ